MDFLETLLSALPDQPIYNVKAVCMRTGIAAARLRAWERRYDLLSPNRSEQNYRLYSERDIGILFWLIQQTESGVSARNAMAQFKAALALGQDIPIRIPAHPVAARNIGRTPRSPSALVNELTEAFLQHNGRTCDELVAEALALYTVETTLINILLVAFAEIRRLKEAGQTTTTAEHFALNYVRQRILGMIQTIPNPRYGQVIITIGFSNEKTEIDILTLGLLFRRQGWNVVNLGADLDPSMLTHALSTLNAGIVLFYCDDPTNALKLTGFPAIIGEHGNPVRTIICGKALKLEPILRRSIFMDFLSSDLRLISNEVVSFLMEESKLALQRKI